MRVTDESRSLQERVSIDGFAIIPNVLPEREIARLQAMLDQSELPRSRAGMRHAMRNESAASLARDPRLIAMAQDVLGSAALPFRATLFDKSPDSNWLVVWHQDTALPLRERREILGWGPWSIKDGVDYAHAPASALEKVLALRLHLDDSVSENGPLRVLPATHTLGVLSDEALHELSTQFQPSIASCREAEFSPCGRSSYTHPRNLNPMLRAACCTLNMLFRPPLRMGLNSQLRE